MMYYLGGCVLGKIYLQRNGKLKEKVLNLKALLDKPGRAK